MGRCIISNYGNSPHGLFDMSDKLTLPQIAALAEKHGYVLVNKEPTNNIGDAWFDAISLMPKDLVNSDDPMGQAAWVYKAMIEAAAVKVDKDA